MAGIQVALVDERDSNWEVDAPRFRVYLQSIVTGPTESASTATYDLVGADALQAIDWAQRAAGDAMTYAVALVWDDDHREHQNPGSGRGLVWLVGRDGNDLVGGEAERAIQDRMLARRADPVRLPERDRIPPDVGHAPTRPED